MFSLCQFVVSVNSKDNESKTQYLLWRDSVTWSKLHVIDKKIQWTNILSWLYNNCVPQIKSNSSWSFDWYVMMWSVCCWMEKSNAVFLEKDTWYTCWKNSGTSYLSQNCIMFFISWIYVKCSKYLHTVYTFDNINTHHLVMFPIHYDITLSHLWMQYNSQNYVTLSMKKNQCFDTAFLMLIS